MAAAHVTGAGLLRASRDQAAPLPQAARGLRACCSGGGVRGADVRADVRGARARDRDRGMRSAGRSGFRGAAPASDPGTEPDPGHTPSCAAR